MLKLKQNNIKPRINYCAGNNQSFDIVENLSKIEPITSHHITSHHITSHHITSHHITSHHKNSTKLTKNQVLLSYVTSKNCILFGFWGLLWEEMLKKYPKPK